MRFPNAQKGVSKIFTAEILALIGIVCMIVSSVIVTVTGGADAASAIGGILVIAFFVLNIIAFILRIVGIGQAGRDDKKFKAAFVLAICSIIGLIVGFVLMAIGSTTGSNVLAVIGMILMILAYIAQLLIIIFVVLGVKSVAEQLNDTSLAKLSKTLFIIIIIVYALEIIAYIIAGISVVTIFASGSLVLPEIAGIMSIVAAILGIVKYILYLIVLGKAKNSFKA